MDCGATTLRRTWKNHVETCPEVISPCAASKYGCTVKIRRAEVATHEQQCPLVAIGPYFEAQNARVESIELKMRHLQQRNEILEDGLANIRSTLVGSAAIGNDSNSGLSISNAERNQQTGAGDVDGSIDHTSNLYSSNPTTYLLSLHESLREEVAQMSHALTDLDARASMTIMNECLRIKEDVAHTNAAVNSVRMQVQWLMNPRLNHGARTGTIRASSSSNDPTRSQLSSASAPGPGNTTGASLGPIRPRRPSDSGREGTKL